ncbi:conserved exported hypothetical protein [metagenome]|uniref:Uncharacterized protein n=1 Tax=metagenome TaxID=256318 RepID=A0A2P2CDA2_9ZZZZ
MNVSRLLATGFVAAIAVPLVLTAPAQAKGSDATIREGSCSGSTDWKVKVKPDDGRLEFEGEIDSNKVGQTWNWVLKHNGTRSASGTATTRAPSGSFSIERRVVNLSGVDKLVFKATNPRSGETCRGVVSR